MFLVYTVLFLIAFPCLVSSFLLNLAYIEIQEMNKNKSAVVAAFDRFLSVLRANLEAIEYRVNSDEVSPEPDSNSSESANSLIASATRRTTANTMFKNNSSVSGDLDALLQAKDLAEWRKEYGLVWNMYMRAARRSVSRQAFRDTFAKARKDRWVPWEVYEAAGSCNLSTACCAVLVRADLHLSNRLIPSQALTEYHAGYATIANRIFDSGAKKFGQDIKFVLARLTFLISSNSIGGKRAKSYLRIFHCVYLAVLAARSVFEHATATFPADRARPLWEKWARYEYQYGDLSAAQKLAKRIAEVYPTGRSKITIYASCSTVRI